MKPFENRTVDGREKSIKRGKVVPPDAVNLAWVKAPKITPDKNIVIVDTSNAVEENSIQDLGARKIYYANGLGILEDRYGNQLVEDEYPIVSDQFLKDEDFSTVPAEEYEDSDVLPFVHVSRFFHADHAGLTLHNDLLTYDTKNIKVVDSGGRDYVDQNSVPRYKVKIFAAYASEDSNQNAYRVHIFIDTDTNEDLYVTYNKVEIDLDGKYFNHNPGHKELLNPIPYYDYVPEESEVVDFVNRDRKIYSTKPTSLKEQILGTPNGAKGGYKVYVPKKAIGDPRAFQLFRWRVTATFKQQYRVDPSSPQGVRCGVVVVDGKRSRTPYAFLNLGRSQTNVTGMRFYNPLKEERVSEVISEDVRETAEYWEVDFNEVTYEELKEFDVLLWSPPKGSTLDLGKYAGKIDYFTSQCGGTLFVDSNTQSMVKGMGLSMLSPVSLTMGSPIMPSTINAHGLLRVYEANIYHDLFSGALKYGGWTFNDDPRLDDSTWNNVSWHQRVLDEYESLSIFSSIYRKYAGAPRVHFMEKVPSGWETLFKIKGGGALPWTNYYPAIITRTFGGLKPYAANAEDNWKNKFNPNYQKVGTAAGKITVSTIGIAESVNALCSHVEQDVVDLNVGAELANYDDYRLYINSSFCEGAYKFLFNLCLMAVKNKPLNSADEKTFSTTFSASSEWKSSWVIDGDVLSESERQRNSFILGPTDSATPSAVWQRQLSTRTLSSIIDDSLTSDMRTKTDGAVREYSIEVTNSKVEVPEDISGTTIPMAWTTEYSPTFEVPIELGPHVIRDEEIKAAYEAGQYIHKSYPSKPYKGRVRIEFVDSEELGTIQPVTWTVTGTVNETITTGKFVPPSTVHKESEIQLSWAEHGSKTLSPSARPWQEGMPVPVGIDTWQNFNYYSTAWGKGQLNWPHYGMYHQLDVGSRGDVVTWVQDCMNVFQFYGFFHYGTLKLDGNYGARTKACVLAFQTAFGCSLLSGVVDAETFSIIGSQIIRLGDLIYKNRSKSGWSKYYFWPKDRIKRQAISDGNNTTAYAKRSWLTGGPSIIWDMFQIVFSQKYDIHGVTFIPYVEGNTPTVMFRSIDVRNQPFNLVNYDSRSGSPIWMPHRPRDGQSIYVPFRKRRGDTLIVGVGQDGPSGHGTSRMLGVRDIRAHAKVKTTTVKPGVNTIKKQTIEREVTMSGTSYQSRVTTKILMPMPKPSTNGKINSVEWDSVTVDNPNVAPELVSGNFGTYLYLSNYVNEARSAAGSSFGPYMPGGYTSYFWKAPDSTKVSRSPESGWISKADGVKILCDKNGTPIGFPDSVPSLSAAANEAQRHFSRLTVETIGNDASVQMGFYDAAQNEFITNEHGEPEMSYIEYLTRGKNNIYIAVVSTYEVETNKPMPVDDDAPLLPYKWAMPVYGLYKKTGSKIAIDSLPSTLGQDDVWPISIRTGKFDKQVPIRSLASGSLSGWLSKYQGETLSVHYSVPEAEYSDWSQLWGPPYADIVGETPEILDDFTLSVRHTPIHAKVVPTERPSLADPMRPMFKVYKRDTVYDDDWVQLKPSEIKDYNISTGEIHLKQGIKTSDPLLWKVDYTTNRRNFYFKGTFNNIVNVNPYSIHSRPFSRHPSHVYILPHYAKDAQNKLIADSVNMRTINITNDTSIFDPLSPTYNPLAIQLGVIYLTTAMDISELSIIDSRRRGGGVKEDATLEELKRLTQDAVSYWDIDYTGAHSYQKSGFVIIRLPAELKNRFTEQEIVEVIENNITAGVKFKIEDLSGNDWD